MASAPETLFSADTATKIVLALIGGLVGFLVSYFMYRIQRRREPRRRISYDLTVGGGMATVPTALAEKVGVTFSGRQVEGQLYEVKARVKNSGNKVVKDQYLRFSFPEGSEILDTYLVNDAPLEFGVRDAPLENQQQTDHRWLIGHLEKNQSVEFGMLIVAQEAAPPQVYGHNEQGDVELESGAAAEKTDDAAHIEPLLLFTSLSIFAPPAIAATVAFGNYLTEILEASIRVALLILLLPHVLPVGRLLKKRIMSKAEDAGTVRIQTESGHVYLATGSSTMRATVSDHRGADLDQDPASRGDANNLSPAVPL